MQKMTVALMKTTSKLKTVIGCEIQGNRRILNGSLCSRDDDGLDAPDWNFGTVKESSENGAVMAEQGRSVSTTSNDIVSSITPKPGRLAPPPVSALHLHSQFLFVLCVMFSWGFPLVISQLCDLYFVRAIATTHAQCLK